MYYIRRIPFNKIYNNSLLLHTTYNISNNIIYNDEIEYLSIMSHLHSINWFSDSIQNDTDDDYFKNYSHMQYINSFYGDFI